jgi:hypothetical protein
MKTILTTLIMFIVLSGKAQVGNVLLGAGITTFSGSLIYYAVGEPKVPTQWVQSTATQYQNDLTRYKNVRTVSLVGSSALLLTSLFVKSWEVKRTEKASVHIAPNQVALTWRF